MAYPFLQQWISDTPPAFESVIAHSPREQAFVTDAAGLFSELRPGFVYEFRLKNLTPGGGDFHPAEAYYTLRVVPR